MADLSTARSIVPVPTLSVITVAVPAAGAEWTVTIPAGHTYRIHSLAYTLVTSATVINRFSGVEMMDPTNRVFGPLVINSLAASLTGLYTAANGISAINLSPRFQETLPIGGLIAPAGFIVRSNTIALQVGDQYSAIFMHVEDIT